MADFCSNCRDYSLARASFFGCDAAPDIDVENFIEKLKEKLKEGSLKNNWGFHGFICEGCGLTAVMWIDNKIQYGYLNLSTEKIDWETKPK